MNTFLKDLAERVISTAAQAAIGVIAVTGFDLFDTHDLTFAGKVALAAALLAFLKGIAATWRGDPESASLVDLDTGRHSDDG